MTVHLAKLCVGAQTIEDQAEFQALRLKNTGRIFHRTRMIPKRKQELLDGGSIYWVIRGLIQARQKLLDIEPYVDDSGIRRCEILLGQELVPVRPMPRRAFQGWRYLESEDAPADLGSEDYSIGKIPPAMRAELLELCLI